VKAGSTAAEIVAAARRILDDEGAEKVSMRRVAEVVGITPMAIYRHFANREALLNAVADHGFDRLATSLKAKRFKGNFEVRLEKMTELYLDHALANPREFELMFIAKRKGARRFPRDFKSGHSPTGNLMAAVIREGMEAGAFITDDVWEIAFEMGALSQGLIMLFLGGRIDATPAAFRSLHRRSLRRYIRGLRA
jgi:AcrR family transcriptional regulator